MIPASMFFTAGSPQKIPVDSLDSTPKPSQRPGSVRDHGCHCQRLLPVGSAQTCFDHLFLAAVDVFLLQQVYTFLDSAFVIQSDASALESSFHPAHWKRDLVNFWLIRFKFEE